MTLVYNCLKRFMNEKKHTLYRAVENVRTMLDMTACNCNTSREGSM